LNPTTRSNPSASPGTPATHQIHATASAAECKRILRRLEALPPYAMKLAEMPEELDHRIQELESQLGEMDSSAPIPPRRIAERVLARPRELRSSVAFAGDQPS